MPNNDTPPVLTSDIESAQARQAATNSQSASTIDSAVSRSTARTRSNAQQSGSAFLGSARGAAGSLVVTFSDIEAMASAITANTAHTEQLLAQVAPISTRADLLESVILSPVTGAEAEASVAAAAGRLVLHIAMSEALGIVSISIVSTYQLVDTALSMSAASLHFIGSAVTTGAEDFVDVGGALVTGIGNEVVTNIEGDVQVIGGFVETVAAEDAAFGTAVLVAGFALNSVTEGFLEEGFTAWFKSFGPTFNQFAKDPWLLLAAPISIPLLMGQNTAAEYSVTDAWGDTYNALQGYLGAMGPGYDQVVGGLLWDFKAFGWSDGGKLGPSLLTAQQLAARRVDFLQGAGEAGITVSADNIAPTNVEQLLLSGGQLDTMGAKDEAVIRVVESGNPPTFTLIIPSTQYWLPWASNDPNDLIGNLNVMMGHSQLENAANQALQTSMTQYQAEHPTADVSKAPVMVAGFSQGGITAGAFAQDYSGQYNIQQVVTAGAPIGRFDIPSSVHVLSYESTADPVPRLDGANNPTTSTWQTVHADDGGTGPGGSHSDLLYAKMAAGNPPDASQQASLNRFLGDNGHVTDYYATK
jgi:hypothetical protein